MAHRLRFRGSVSLIYTIDREEHGFFSTKLVAHLTYVFAGTLVPAWMRHMQRSRARRSPREVEQHMLTQLFDNARVPGYLDEDHYCRCQQTWNSCVLHLLPEVSNSRSRSARERDIGLDLVEAELMQRSSVRPTYSFAQKHMH